MRKLVYYILLVILLILCMITVFLLIFLAEDVFNFRAGTVLINFGYIIGFGLFFSIKPFLRYWLIDNKMNCREDKLKEKENSSTTEQ